MSNVEEFEPPKSVWSRAGAYAYEQGAWFPADRGTNVVQLPARTIGGAAPAKAPASSTPTIKKDDWVLGMDGWVLKEHDPVVFVPNDPKYDLLFGKITFYGGRQGCVYVDIEFDAGLSEEICLPVKQLLPLSEFRHSEWAKQGQLALPPAKGEEKNDDLVDFYVPRSTTELVEAIDDIFGPDTLQLMPGFAEWDRGDYPEMTFDDVIDVEEVNTDG
jgi:hypothetical protein